MNSDESVSLQFFPVNLVHHFSAGSTARDSPRLVRLIIYLFLFLKQKSNSKKNNKKILCELMEML